MNPGLSQASDQDLAVYARAGRDDAYRELLSRYKAPVYRLIVKHVGDPDEALDLTQETFLAGFSAMSRYDADRPFRVWIARIAINKCRDWARRRKVRAFFSRALPLESAHHVGHRAQVRLVGGARPLLRRLDPELREIVVEGADPLVRVFAQRQAGGARAGDGLVVHVRVVQRVHDLVSAEVLQCAPQDVHADERAEVADMRAGVDGGPARVHPDRIVAQRGEGLLLTRQRIVEAHHRMVRR